MRENDETPGHLYVARALGRVAIRQAARTTTDPRVQVVVVVVMRAKPDTMGSA